MIGGLHSARSLPHLSELVPIADAVGALEQPQLAAERWNNILALNGISQPDVQPNPFRAPPQWPLIPGQS